MAAAESAGSGPRRRAGETSEILDDEPIEVVLSKLTAAQNKEIHAIFNLMAGGDNAIDAHDIMQAMLDVGTDPTDKEVRDLITCTAGDAGRMDFDTFLRCMASYYLDEEHV